MILACTEYLRRFITQALDRVQEELGVYSAKIFTIGSELQRLRNNPINFDELPSLVPDVESYVSLSSYCFFRAMHVAIYARYCN